jgi:hypothetical protein
MRSVPYTSGLSSSLRDRGRSQIWCQNRKTSSVFKRYAIVDKTDIRAALQQLERARRMPLDPTDGRRSTEPEYPPLSELRQLPII